MDFNHIETPRFLLRIVTPEVHSHAMETLSDSELMEFFGLDEAGLEKTEIAAGMRAHHFQ
ncbi:hypothetical protein LRS05_12525 [Flavobacterium sp. J372]|uniref:hypothetical protein n=1 Tax=Flavobacterium sp. J372 TaxID=2898436 RepID=UPI002150A562|nr:hypothetical protein [Flavobacterium sp. J372]MCR5862907.1 hypothetical protein [Flavobacterium sp. J372]